MTEILSTLAFALMMGAQLLAVVAAHRLKDTAQADQTSAAEMPRFSDHNLFVTAERLHASP
jgi:hypothetical protein